MNMYPTRADIEKAIALIKICLEHANDLDISTYASGDNTEGAYVNVEFRGRSIPLHKLRELQATSEERRKLAESLHAPGDAGQDVPA